jgi:SAM-dependent methyltransferase
MTRSSALFQPRITTGSATPRSTSMPDKDFSRLEYRRSDAWPRRIEREGPFIAGLLAAAPRGAPWVLDLGCGSGEHVRWLATSGHPALGLDRSADALLLASEARDRLEPGAPAPAPGSARWLRADLRALPLAAGSARLALCLGNTLVLLGDDGPILEALREARRALAPGGALLVQIINYHRLRKLQERALPINFRRPPEATEDPSEELVYLRLMDFDEPEHVSFHAITLARRSGSDDIAVRRSVRRRLRSLEADGLASLLREAGFDEIRLHGDFAGSPFEPLVSADVIALARVAAGTAVRSALPRAQALRRPPLRE